MNWLDRAEAFFAELGNEEGLGQVFHEKGTARVRQGDRTTGREFYEKSLAIRHKLGEQVSIAQLLNNLAIIDVYEGKFESGESRYRESLNISRELGEKWMESIALLNLGYLVNVQDGIQAEAKVFLEQSIRIQRELGTLPNLSIALHNLGNVARDSGDFAGAKVAYRESLTTYENIGAGQELPGLLADVSGLAACEGQHTQALALFAAAEAQHQAISGTIAPVERAKLERLLAPARAALSAEATQQAVILGQSLTMKEAFGYLVLES